MARVGRTGTGSYNGYQMRINGSRPVSALKAIQPTPRVGRVGRVSSTPDADSSEGGSFADILARLLSAGKQKEQPVKTAPATYTYHKKELEQFQADLYHFSSRRTTDIPLDQTGGYQRAL